MAGRGEHVEGIFHLDLWGGKEGGWRVQNQTTRSHPTSHPPRITQLRFHTHTDEGSCTLGHTSVVGTVENEYHEMPIAMRMPE